MAIYAYYGKPGQGKSYSVVANVIVPALIKGRSVYTNIPLTEKVHSLGGQVIPFDSSVGVEYFPTVEKGAVLVIDEAWRYCPSGEPSNKMNPEWKEFLTMHRHLVNSKGESTQIYFITQSQSQINVFVKSLVDTSYLITKRTALGINKFRTDCFSGAGADKASGKADRSFFSAFEPKYFAYYKTSTQSDTGEVGDEIVIDDRGSLAKRWIIRYGMPLALAFLVFGGYNSYSYLANLSESPEEIKNEVTTAVSSVSVPSSSSSPLPVRPSSKPVSPPPKPVGPQPSKFLRVSGYAQYKSDLVFVHIEHVNGYIFEVSSLDCAPKYGSFVCVIDGEIVSPLTGVYKDDPSDHVRTEMPFSS